MNEEAEMNSWASVSDHKTIILKAGICPESDSEILNNYKFIAKAKSNRHKITYWTTENQLFLENGIQNFTSNLPFGHDFTINKM